MSADAISALARRQRGYVTRAQLLALGLGSDAIDHRVRKGTLIRVHLGVYAVGHIPLAAADRAAGALLACGPRAVLSHQSALSLWGFATAWEMPFHVTAPTDHRRENIRTHRSQALAPIDIRRHLGLRVTSPARTLLDVASRTEERALRRAVNDAQISGYLRREALAEVLGRFPRHPGTRHLRPLVETVHRPTRSEFEDAFVTFVERHGLPRPQLNVRAAGREVDALFAAERLIVELDGYETHSSKVSFEDDRERDADSELLGLGTVRLTWERLTQRADEEAQRIHAILARRRRAA